ncbi:hypothetical protein JJB07_01970 [Tumebacillus sp. ITR2]|uniref:Peptidase M1 membrane alanine aminopeptidase domain-containing protein n=1 Tax=Tumebacillus amylolyticus TaxID=2801339 RepID=A0ABS1J590_9BACL|nr:M1 family aminopeptidase [Tumebacillus amylolyticus]MBL0385402.1 hypothetical protein [Tumebacillus amylolyticus]
MRRKRRGLILYSMLLTLLSTLVILAIVLRPTVGWSPIVKDTYQRWFGSKPIAYQPLAVPTPHESTYGIKAFFDEGKHVISVEETVKIPQLNVSGIPFYLYTPESALQIHEVKLNGQEVKYDLNAKQITLQATPAQTEQTVTLKFDVSVPDSAKRFGMYKGVATVCYWYPILAVERDGHWVPRPDSLGFGDPFLMDLGNYQVEWNAPAGFKWYGTGSKLSETTVEGGRVVSTWKADKVRNFALVGGRGFQETAFETGYGTHVVVATIDPARLAQTAELAKSAVSTYSDRVGIDPYPVLNVLELPAGTIYAHELPNLALFSQDLWGYDDPEHWIAHEIGHVWFYNAVGNYEAETPWLDEGLADYLSLIEIETRQGTDAYQAMIQGDWQRFKAGDTYSPYKPGTPAGVKNGETAVPYGTYPTSQAHYYYSYLRPILMYHDLRMQLGDEKFFKFLKQYYLKNVERTATRADLEQALSDIDPAMVARMKLWLDTPNDQLLGQVKAAFEG